MFLRGKTIMTVGTGQLVMDRCFEVRGIDGHGKSIVILKGHADSLLMTSKTQFCFIIERFCPGDTGDRVGPVAVSADRGGPRLLSAQHIDVDGSFPDLI